MRLPILISLIFSATYAAKIALFVLPMSNSHVIFTNAVAEELAQDNEVVIIRPNANPKASTIVSKHPKVSEIRTAGIPLESYYEFKKYEKNFVWGEVSLTNGYYAMTHYRQMVTEACENFVDDEFMNRMREEKFDLAIAHHLDPCPVSVIHAAGIPMYGYILSTPLIKMFVNQIGIPSLTSTFPSHLLDNSNEMTTIQRLKNFALDLLMSQIGGYFQGMPVDKIFRAKYGEDFPSNMELSKKAKFLLANVHPDIEFPIPVTSKVTYFGGLGMSNETKPLEEPYLSFVNKAKKVVFVSFGTVADPKIMPIEWKQAFVELFEKNPDIHFIWRMENDIQVPKNVLRNVWHPQKDLLGHPKVAAFITHAGYNSLGESIASGTPLITVPLFADQFRNSRLAEYRGFGVRVEKTEMTFEKLNEALHKVLEDSSYEQNAKSLRRIVFSSPVSAGDALRHAVNFALENPNHNRDLPSLPFYKLYSLDMIFIIFIFPLCIPILAKWYFWSCCKMAYKEKEKMN